MAKARAIVKRRKAVQNIRKITQTMQLIATARFQKCLQRATATKPYTAKLTEMVEALSGTEAVRRILAAAQADGGAGGAPGRDASGAAGPPLARDTLDAVRLLQPNRDAAGCAILAVTSNRGLCGGYNASVLRLATEQQRRAAAGGLAAVMDVIGKKGVNYLRFLGQPVAFKITDVEDKIEYARVAELAERYMKMYREGQVARVEVVYMRFVSVGSQRPTAVQLLPMQPPRAADAPGAAVSGKTIDYEFSPAPESLLARLIPETVRIRLMQYINDAIVSEQVARMVAMKSATDAAGEMIRSLTRGYNRARQTQITMELLDIVGGAEAVK